MEGIIILSVISAILIAVSAIILSGKGDKLIAGYKTAGEKERQQYHIKRQEPVPRYTYKPQLE